MMDFLIRLMIPGLLLALVLIAGGCGLLRFLLLLRLVKSSTTDPNNKNSNRWRTKQEQPTNKNYGLENIINMILRRILNMIVLWLICWLVSGMLELVVFLLLILKRKTYDQH